MKRLLERAGQRRLFCEDIDRAGFWRWPEVWGGLDFDDDAYDAAVDTHEFEALLNDGEATFLVCAACDAEIWVQDGVIGSPA